MILKNFIYWTQNNVGTYKNFLGNDTTQANIGENITNYSNAVNCYYTNNLRGSYVDVGFGNTPETADDYKLANSNAIDTPKLTFISNGFVTAGTYPYIRNLTTTYSNDTENYVTITEVGYVQKAAQASNGGYNCLLTRTVLDTPIFVPAGKSVSVTITMEI